MTILDLINKSVTGEEMPENIWWDEEEFAYIKGANDYFSNGYGDYLFNHTRNYLDEVKTIKEPLIDADKKAKVMASLEELVEDLMGYGE